MLNLKRGHARRSGTAVAQGLYDSTINANSNSSVTIETSRLCDGVQERLYLRRGTMAWRLLTAHFYSKGRLGRCPPSAKEKVNGGWLVLNLESKLLSFASAPQIIGWA